MNMQPKQNPKDWKSITIYMIPVIALVLANVLQIQDVAEVERNVTAIATSGMAVVGGIITFIGIIKNNNKNGDKSIRK